MADPKNTHDTSKNNVRRERALEIAGKAKGNLTALEAHPSVNKDKGLRKLVFAVHNDLQVILEEIGPVAGLTNDDVIVYGGGTPKSEEEN
ncbi:hypothetical protein IC614_03095 [Allosphingosinicella flava]|uniref:Uncharacterized protein n=1 Tax=Allosphingosinicella flava TaxID=2771430 RepID=A0A7T2GKL7_9SPHN|nr:hypothetical protein [Sphingosinicella flava]QPQ55603.1 hypothetical protein IC614_03095 [Sphingosinicella flava]